MRSNLDLSNPFGALRAKWSEVPAGNKRLNTKQLLDMNDQELLGLWSDAKLEATTGKNFNVRGWYHALYTPALKGLTVLDVGSGFGIDGITFAQAGAKMTFLDIIESNLHVTRRICELLHLENVDFFYIEDFSSFSNLETQYDVIWCQGSLICVPFDLARSESQELLKHLKPNGRWIELAYPRTRWERDGKPPFDKWGQVTDGGAPWIEWYDLEKLLARLYPSKFDVVLGFEFHSADFVWFDLQHSILSP
jgi:2-polyprenyl-3-methyl-5-hydroxy-6-metoxy-1,4-benzoquinol methylase